VTRQRIWSFDDRHIGKIAGSALGTREIARPVGVNRSDWYGFAGQVVSLLNATRPAHDMAAVVEALEAICAEAESMTMTMRRRKIFDQGKAALQSLRGQP